MRDLTILIQGPFFEFQAYNSNKNIKILKKNFPLSNILISTWEGEKRFKLENNEKIIFNSDPGFVKDNHIGSTTPGSNIQRQINSVKNGLEEIKTKYTLKIRSDCYFSSDKILNLNSTKFKINPKYQLLNERIVTSSIGSLNQNETQILYHYSDWFNLGLTEDLKKLWCNTKIENDDINFFSKFLNKKQNIYGKDWDLKYTAEQFIYYKPYLKRFKKKLDHAHDYSNEKLKEANNYLVNNFFLADPDEIDFIFPKYDQNINKELEKKNTNIRSKELIFLSYSNEEWIELYFKTNKIKYSSKLNLKKKIFRLKFKVKNFLYKYLRFIFN